MPGLLVRALLVAAFVAVTAIGLQPPVFGGWAAFQDSNSSPGCWTVNPATGWTTLCPGAGTQYIAVANAGSNTCTAQATAALAQAAPCQTITKAITLLPAGASDYWIMLNRGDTFTDDFDSWCLQKGNSSTDPILVTNYGSGAQPIVQGAQAGTQWFKPTGGGCSGDKVAFVGLSFYNNKWDPGNVAFNSGSSPEVFGNNNLVTWFLIEDCSFNFGVSNMITFDSSNNAGPSSNVTVRRSKIRNTYSLGGPNQIADGIYIAGVNNVTIDTVLFDHNGWSATVANGGPSVKSHNIYFNCGPLDMTNGASLGFVLKNSFLTRDSSGNQFRCGGTIGPGNAFVGGLYSFVVGMPSASSSTTVSWNVGQFQQDNNVNGCGNCSAGDMFANMEPDLSDNWWQAPVTFSNNIVNHSLTPNANGGAFYFTSNLTTGEGTQSSNLSCRNKNNTHSGSCSGLFCDLNSSTLSGNLGKISDCNSGSWTPSQPTLTDPNRTAGSYCASLGSACSASASATFTASITAGSMSVTAFTTGNLQLGDAIIYSGQTQADYVVSCPGGVCNGATGTYGLAGTETVGSLTMTSFTLGQLMTAAGAMDKTTWNSSLTGCAYAQYVHAGFGLTNPCVP